MELTLFLTAFGIMVVSLIGVLLTIRFFSDLVTTRLPLFIAFSAGVFLFTVAYLIWEALETTGSFAITGLLVLGGFIASYLLTTFLKNFHHHHGDYQPAHSHTKGTSVIVGDAVHNISDGLLLVPAFMVSPSLGFAVGFSIAVHEALQELSEYLVLRSAGYSTKRALLINFLVSSTILIGVAIGLLVAQTTFLQGALLALSAGFFINLIISDLLPQLYVSGFSLKQFLSRIGLVLAGFAMIAVVNAQAPHGHNHGSHSDDHHAGENHNHDHGLQDHTDPHDHDTHAENHHSDRHDDPVYPDDIDRKELHHEHDNHDNSAAKEQASHDDDHEGHDHEHDLQVGNTAI